MTLADQAVALAQRGFHVFPCISTGQRKKPSIKNWKTEATRDETRIRAWWGGAFKGCAIGIAHGKFGNGEDYLVTVDCDNKHGKNGADRLFELELEHGDLPRTYTQRTQSGGSHLVFKTKYPLKNGVDVRPGLDIRGARGLIYAAGSVWNGKAYTIEHDVDVAEAPEWLVQLAGIQAPKELKETVAEGVTLDTDDQLKRAKDYLETTREAVRGNAGDERVLQVAMKVGDLGVSQYECLDLMQKHFADRCAPPLDPAYLEQKVENAYAYREEPLGNALASQDFTDEPTIPVETAPPPADFEAVSVDDAFVDVGADLPKRQWVMGRTLMKGKVTVLVAAPGVGKSTLTNQWAVAIAMMVDSIAGEAVYIPGNTLVINNEDETDELRRRLAAIYQANALKPSKSKNRVFTYSGVENPFLVAKRDRDGNIKTAIDVQRVIDFCQKNNIVAAFIDPLVETHEANENDNREMNAVGRLYREIAHRAGVAVCLVVHSRKPGNAKADAYIGQMDSIRGASATAGVARIVKTLNGMTEKDAAAFGIPEAERHLYVRMDDAKANLSLTSTKAWWAKKTGILLPNGDEVGYLSPVKLEHRNVDLAAVTAAAIVDLFDVEKKARMSTRSVAEKLLAGGAVVAIGARSAVTVQKNLVELFADPVVSGVYQIHIEEVESDKSRSAKAYFVRLPAVVSGSTEKSENAVLQR